MDFIELVVWVLAVVGVLGANLYKQWQRHREMRRPLPRVPPHRVPPAEEAVLLPPAAPAPERPGRFDEADWGRAPRREEAMSLERLLEQVLGEQAEQQVEQGPEQRPQPVAPAEAQPRTLPAREAPVYATAASTIAQRTPGGAPARMLPGQRRRRPLFNPHTDPRAAVIGMTVLGPCRAQAPYEPPGS